jgi:Carboxypeptidase regulatory-like domain
MNSYSLDGLSPAIAIRGNYKEVLFMRRNALISFLILGLVSFFTLSAFSQDIETRGSIRGTVTDPNGANVVGAQVTVTGANGVRNTTTNDQGGYEVTNLTPGNYSVRIELTGFRSVSATNQTVFVGKATTVDAKLTVGEATAIVEVTATNEVDQQSTSVETNLNDELFQNIPVARQVSGLFYLAPGTTDSLSGGRDNPSISGGSALDNLYIADGVNITNSAFGGIGTFSRVYGALGTGINTSFVKEVQVKTGGFEPRYGQSIGGVVNIVTQSGSNDFHGALYGFARPSAFEGTYKQRDDFSVNKVGEILNNENYDAGFDIGGPIVKDRLFFFGSFNPTINRAIVQGAEGTGLFTQLGRHSQRTRSLNYAGKIDWNIASNHTLSFSIFGDPSKTNLSSFNTLNINNTSALSQLDYGSQNVSLRYNGVYGKSWTLSASYGLNRNRFNETGFADVNEIQDLTGPALGTGSSFIAQGLGFVEPTKGRTHQLTFDVTKTLTFLGQHNIGFGYNYQRGFYGGNRRYSGPTYTIPAQNAAGENLADLFPATAPAIGQTVDAAFSLRVAAATCTLCPFLDIPGAGPTRVYLRMERGEYGNPVFDTRSHYNAAYIQDTWRFNKYVTALIGIRNEQEKMIGSPSSTGQRVSYSFTGQWAPRIGVTVDPTGSGRMKAYYNFGRFFEFLPLDLAERSLSAEQDFTLARLAPASAPCVINGNAEQCAVLNEFGTVTPAFDAMHLLNGAAGGFPTAGIAVSSNDPSNPILSGTKLGYLNEHVIGFDIQLPKNFFFSARYIDRRIKRIVEDAAVVSPEQANGGLFGQTYFLANVNSSLDAAVNPIPHVFAPTLDPTGTFVTNWPAACGPVDDETHQPLFGIPAVEDPRSQALLGAICFDPNPLAGELGSDGIPDGFPNPIRNYQAVEFEINKRFSNNWQLLSNWRIARLRGNYEGHLRNDNAQTDPGISSLFDFTAGEFNLLGDQFAVGPLNSDRRHVVNIFGNYTVSSSGFTRGFFGNRVNGLNLGFGIHSESGIPISELLAHPVYGNAGEIPVGGRGKLGRTPWFTRLDLHADYPWNFSERTRLKFIADVFNVTNNRRVRRFNEFRELSLGIDNVDFLQPRNFYAPISLRLGMRLEF